MHDASGTCLCVTGPMPSLESFGSDRRGEGVCSKTDQATRQLLSLPVAFLCCLEQSSDTCGIPKLPKGCSNAEQGARRVAAQRSHSIRTEESMSVGSVAAVGCRLAESSQTLCAGSGTHSPPVDLKSLCACAMRTCRTQCCGHRHLTSSGVSSSPGGKVNGSSWAPFDPTSRGRQCSQVIRCLRGNMCRPLARAPAPGAVTF